MVGSWFVKGRGDHLSIDIASHIGHLLGTLIDQENDHIDLRMIGRDCIGNVLE